MMNKHSPSTFQGKLAICVACTFMLGCASAQTASPTTSGDAWRVQLTPYIWGTGLDGRIRPFEGAPTAHASKSFSDIISHLDAAFFVTGRASKGNFVLHGDLSRASTTENADLPQNLSARVNVRQSSVSLAAGYNWNVGANSSVDLLGGVRYWDIHAKVQIPGVVATHTKASFTDPIVAVRWRYDFAPRWSTLVYADAGGFGVGSNSTWQALGSVNYEFKDNFHVSLGYRYLKLNYHSDGKLMKFSQSGPLIGLTYRF